MTRMPPLTPQEIEILQACAGERPPRDWGAAVGQAIEVLRTRGLLSPKGSITAAGLAFLKTLPVPGTPRRCVRV